MKLPFKNKSEVLIITSHLWRTVRSLEEMLGKDDEQVLTAAGNASYARAQERPRTKRDTVFPKGTVPS